MYVYSPGFCPSSILVNGAGVVVFCAVLLSSVYVCVYCRVRTKLMQEQSRSCLYLEAGLTLQ